MHTNHIFLVRSLNTRVETFEELRWLTEPYFIHDRIYQKWYSGTIALNAYEVEWEINPAMAKTSRNFGDWQFVNINLSVQDQKSFGEWFADHETEILPMLSEVNADGYKFSISYDFDNECFIAALSGTKNTTENGGCTITARSSEWIESIGLVLFKHVVMCHTGSWQDYAKPANWG